MIYYGDTLDAANCITELALVDIRSSKVIQMLRIEYRFTCTIELQSIWIIYKWGPDKMADISSALNKSCLDLFSMSLSFIPRGKLALNQH